MTHTEILNRILASKSRVIKLTTELQSRTAKTGTEIAVEGDVQVTLMQELQASISETIGQPVHIGMQSSVVKTIPALPSDPTEKVYDKEGVTARIVALRRQNMTFNTIACTLNAEGLRPRSAKTFSPATVYQLFRVWVHDVTETTTTFGV